MEVVCNSEQSTVRAPDLTADMPGHASAVVELPPQLQTDCIEKKDSPDVFFCCCEGNMCNERFFYFPEMEVTQPTSNPVTPKPPLFNTLLYSLVPIMGIAVIILFSFWMYRHHKLAYPPVLVPTQLSYCKCIFIQLLDHIEQEFHLTL
ncbi:Activin receptor type-2A [Chelonia mydas]|uniref:Activin receptor type-2A n=1 Tax=Chelonia mydas TaxID=8469 RepID=M7B7M7_CHEMY|nr:Activin receptor type-2A [Chelonia mydas]